MAERRLSRGSAPALMVPTGVSGVVSKRAGRSGRNSSRERSAEAAPIIVPMIGQGGEPVLDLLKGSRVVEPAFRVSANYHVSDVVNGCLRRSAIIERMGMSIPSSSLPDGVTITYALGHAVGRYVVDRFVSAHPNKIWAEWSCACGKTRERAIFADREVTKCRVCGGDVTTHNEVPFVNEDLGVSGSPDILLWLEEYQAFYIIEVKSISAKQFAELARPIPTHVLQVLFYHKLLRDKKFPVLDACSVLYVNKEYTFKNPYKEFVLTHDGDARIAPYMADLQDAKAAKQCGQFPPRICCATADAPAAKTCPVKAVCFA